MLNLKVKGTNVMLSNVVQLCNELNVLSYLPFSDTCGKRTYIMVHCILLFVASAGNSRVQGFLRFPTRSEVDKE